MTPPFENAIHTRSTILPALLARHVDDFNRGARSGDWGPMLESFAPDSRLSFEGVPVGPFSGRAAIAEAYRLQPPDDTICILDVRQASASELVAGYAWSREPAMRAGELRLLHDGTQIRQLTVTFERAEPAGR